MRSLSKIFAAFALVFVLTAAAPCGEMNTGLQSTKSSNTISTTDSLIFSLSSVLQFVGFAL